jgi:hypothetical protein
VRAEVISAYHLRHCGRSPHAVERRIAKDGAHDSRPRGPVRSGWANER